MVSKLTTEDDNTNVYIDNNVDNFPAGACYASRIADSVIITQKLLSKQNQIPQQLLHVSVPLKYAHFLETIQYFEHQLKSGESGETFKQRNR